MKLAHSANVRVFCSQEESQEEILNGLKQLLPFNLEEGKISLQRQVALGFNDRKILIFEVTLTKETQVSIFLKNLFEKINAQQKQMLLDQLETRVDDQANLYIRLEKSIMINGEALLTDGGNCYHLKIKLAAYPSSRKKGIELAKELISS